MYIPERFKRRVDAHVLGNMLDIEQYPVILAIIGRPGTGKTFQLRHYLNSVGVAIFSMSAANLEDVEAGKPAKELADTYAAASEAIAAKQPAVLLIDDIDTTLGEWENYTGTVNHQDILAFLMHIADNPRFIEGKGELQRVPTFFTGNHFERLYEPLVREGRVARFDWEPNIGELVNIAASIFGLNDPRDARALVEAYPEKTPAFFSDLLIGQTVDELAKMADSVAFKYILTEPGYREALVRQYRDESRKVIRNIRAEAAAARRK